MRILRGRALRATDRPLRATRGAWCVRGGGVLRRRSHQPLNPGRGPARRRCPTARRRRRAAASGTRRPGAGPWPRRRRVADLAARRPCRAGVVRDARRSRSQFASACGVCRPRRCTPEPLSTLTRTSLGAHAAARRACRAPTRGRSWSRAMGASPRSRASTASASGCFTSEDRLPADRLPGVSHGRVSNCRPPPSPDEPDERPHELVEARRGRTRCRREVRDQRVGEVGRDQRVVDVRSHRDPPELLDEVLLALRSGRCRPGVGLAPPLARRGSYVPWGRGSRGGGPARTAARRRRRAGSSRRRTASAEPGELVARRRPGSRRAPCRPRSRCPRRS